MSEQYTTANGVRLAYEEFGSPKNPAMLLIMGLGTQMIAWPPDFCQGLADHGFRVIRFDNRDIGLSEKMENAHIPQATRLMVFSRLKLPVRVPYTLTDMARDAVGLMDSLGIDKAHVVGASMGGMIGQILAARFGERVISLTSIMSSSGNPKLPGPSKEVVRLMVKRSLGKAPPTVESSMAFWRLIGSPDYQPSDDELRNKILASLERSNHPEGYSRHLAAIIANGSRVKMLRKITAPTLIIHGKDDVLVPVEGGIDTARQISGSRLEVIAGMGHDLPRQLLPRFIELIEEHARGAHAVASAA